MTPIEYETSPVTLTDDVGNTDLHLESWLMKMSIGKREIPIGNAMFKYSFDECSAMLEDAAYMSRLAELRFDIAVVDRFECGPCYYLIPHVLKVPYVTVSAFYHTHYAVLPSLFPVGIYPQDERLSFNQRLLNSVFGLMLNFLASPYLGLFDHSLVTKFAPQVSSYNDLRDAAWLSFVTFDHVLNWPRPAMPNVILVGAVTMNRATKLDESFESLATNSAQHGGLIVVSFGSMGNHLPGEIVDKMFAALKHFKHTVVFLFDPALVTNLREKVPENIHLYSWIPQNDLLAHTNTKLFITHCGNNGQYEAVYHGVPMIGFPLFGDQNFNAFRISRRGFGLTMDISDFTSEELRDAIDDVLSNETFATNVAKAAAILQDAPMMPREVVAYWIDHVLRYGPNHLQSAADDLRWFELYCIDVMMVLTALAAVIVYLGFILCRCVYRRVLKLYRGSR